MTGPLTSLYLAVLAGWTGFALAGLATDAAPVQAASAGVGAAAVLALRRSRAVGGLVAVLEPLGVILPLLSLRHMAAAAGLPLAPFSTVEIAVFAGLYLLFLMAAGGMLPAAPYRLGYAPLPVGVLVIALCLYGAATGNLFLPLAAVLGQALWVAGWGSSNYFDHLLHVLLVPVATVALIGRMLAM